MSNLKRSLYPITVLVFAASLLCLGCPFWVGGGGGGGGDDPQEVSVPDVMGMAQAEAEAAIVDAGLVVGAVDTDYSESVPEGHVLSQSPRGGSRVAQATAVVLVVSRGSASADEVTIMLPGDVPLEMIRIPAGTFMMGQYPREQDSLDLEDPQHEVTIGYDFWMGRYTVTMAQWIAVMGTEPWYGRWGVLDHPDSPALSVSWNMAHDFITAVNAHIVATGQGGDNVRLPSEAEWEYACRARTTSRFYWGEDPRYTQISNYAWWRGNAEDMGNMYAHVVGQKLPNAFGLHDMSGNVLEWCEDDWHTSYVRAPADGSAWVDSPRGSYRVVRGGDWGSLGDACRSAFRTYDGPAGTYINFGFRLAR